jgi:DNA-binding Lrp family transcriptional regulator
MSKAEVLSAIKVIGPMSRVELEKYLGLASSSVQESVARLRRDGVVCVVKYEMGARRCERRPVYGLGSSDVQVPAAEPRAEQYKRSNKARAVRAKAIRERRVASPWDALLKRVA